jgi:hypothetical protein
MAKIISFVVRYSIHEVLKFLNRTILKEKIWKVGEEGRVVL